jgi:hypothetical protein
LALAGTTNETCAEDPALIVREHDGEQLTPLGSPVTATETAPEKPFEPATDTVTGALTVPACALTDEGVAEMEKSAAAVMVRLIVALWLRLPFVPFAVSVTVPAVALAGTTNETCTEDPALIVREHDGEQLTPLGSPVTATETAPAKPFEPAIETVTGALVVPVCALTDDGETEIEKSGGGLDIDPPPPQPIRRPPAAHSQATSTRPKREMQ